MTNICYSIVELYNSLSIFFFFFFLGEKGSTGEDFDQEESSDRQRHRSFTVHSTSGIEFRFSIMADPLSEIIKLLHEYNIMFYFELWCATTFFHLS